MSYTRHYYHVVFSPKGREPLLLTELKRDVYNILYKLFMKHNCFVYRINGMEDHVHILVSIPAKLAVSDVIKIIKSESSAQIKNNRVLPHWVGWQEGYSSFTCSYRELNMVTNYIKNQEEHHKHVTFLDEYRKMLIESGVSPDDPYFPK